MTSLAAGVGVPPSKSHYTEQLAMTGGIPIVVPLISPPSQGNFAKIVIQAVPPIAGKGQVQRRRSKTMLRCRLNSKSDTSAIGGRGGGHRSGSGYRESLNNTINFGRRQATNDPFINEKIAHSFRVNTNLMQASSPSNTLQNSALQTAHVS